MIITEAVLDTSVVIKWIRQGEEHQNEALWLRDRYLDGKLVIAVPELLLYELANALRHKPGAAKEHVHKAVDSILDLGIEVLHPTFAVMHSAVHLAFHYDVTFYDALFLAVAEDLRYNFITADGVFYKKIKGRAGSHLLRDIKQELQKEE